MDTDRAALTIAHPRWLRVGLAAVPVGFLAIFYLWPLVTLLARVIDRRALADTLSRDGLAGVVWFTAWQAVVSTALTIVVGLAPAYLLARWSFPGRRVLYAVVTVPFLLPTVVVGAAFVAMLPDRLSGTATAVVLAHVFFNIAVVVRIVGALWEQLPADLAGAARTLGASPWRTAREVTLPLLRPAIMAAAAVTFIFTFTSFGVVQIVGGPANPTLEVEIARRAAQLGDISGAAVLAVLQLIVLGVLIVWSGRAQRRATTQLSIGVVRRSTPSTRRTRTFVGLGAAATALAVIAPLATLAVASFRPSGRWSLTAWSTLGSSEIRPGLSLGVDPLAAMVASARYAAAATVISVALGALASLAIAASRRAGRLLDLGVMLPLGTSAVTIGLGMLITFDRAPFDWRAEPWLIPLGHALVAIPFVVRTTLPALRARPDGWVEAAATLGASPARAWWHIDVRLLARPLVVAAGFAAAISLGEFGATTFLTRAGRETMPIAIARLLARAGDIPRAQGFALATVLAVATTLLVVGVEAIHTPDGRERGERARRS